MSLRSRLLLSIVAVMMLTMALGAVVVMMNGRKQVRTELAAALNVAAVSVKDNDVLSNDDGQQRRNLMQLVSTFDGARNVGVALVTADGRVLAVSTILKPADMAPGWFVALLTPALPAIAIKLDDGGNFFGRLVISPVAINEASEVWANLADDVVLGATFLLLAILLIYLTAAWLVSPVTSLASGLADLRDGRVGGRIEAKGPRELRRVIAEFNALTSELATAQAQTRALEDQLATLQDEERAELSRDLHDDIGPLLFSAKIDLAAMSRHAAVRDDERLVAQVDGVTGIITSVQLSLRDILVRLRPCRGLEAGLPQALETLVAHWRDRYPGIGFRLDVNGDVDLIDEIVRDCAYSIAQEALSNALRHANATTIDMTIALERDRLVLTVTNDGIGAALPNHAGIGLKTMRERADARGGALAIRRGQAPARWIVEAVLPVGGYDNPLEQAA